MGDTVILTDLMSEEEKFAYANFRQRHCKCGQRISVEITPTGIGYNFLCKCYGCNTTQDITEYDNW